MECSVRYRAVNLWAILSLQGSKAGSSHLGALLFNLFSRNGMVARRGCLYPHTSLSSLQNKAHSYTHIHESSFQKKRLQVLDRSNYDLMGPNKKIPDRPPVTDSPPEVRRSQRVLTPTTGLSAQLIKRHARLRQTSKFQNPGCFGLRESVNNHSHNPRQRGAAREDHRQEEEKNTRN